MEKIPGPIPSSGSLSDDSSSAERVLVFSWTKPGYSPSGRQLDVELQSNSPATGTAPPASPAAPPPAPPPASPVVVRLPPPRERTLQLLATTPTTVLATPPANASWLSGVYKSTPTCVSEPLGASPAVPLDAESVVSGTGSSSLESSAGEKVLVYSWTKPGFSPESRGPRKSLRKEKD